MLEVGLLASGWMKCWKLADLSVKMVREEEMAKILVKAEELAEERLLDLLLPKRKEPIVEDVIEDAKPEGELIEKPEKSYRQRHRGKSCR